MTRILTVLCTLLFLLMSTAGQVYANSVSDRQRFTTDAPYYWPGLNCGGVVVGVAGNTAPVTGNGAWNSGLQPPYWLEEFVINVLQDIAKTMNVSDTKTVTQEHVVALVAWAWSEGGNISNTDIFNPWNTGLNRPDLLAGDHADNGVQSFRSFDAGVTAATISMTGSFQNRLAKVLTDQNSTAEQFMNALTFYQRYAGNKAWAEADIQNQSAYLNGLMTMLKQTRSNYAQYASVEIGSGEENTHRVPASKLKFNGGNNNPTSGNGAGSTGTAGNGCPISESSSSTCQNNNGNQATGTEAIACQVLKYDTLSYSQGWHSSGSVFHKNCDDTYKQLGKNPPQMVDGHAVGPLCATDCSGLINIALFDLFGNNGSWTTFTELTDPANFKRIPLSQVRPGDFIQPNPDHVEIIESVSGTTLHTFAAHTSHTTQPNQVGPAQYPVAPGYVYLRYVGKGV